METVILTNNLIATALCLHLAREATGIGFMVKHRTALAATVRH